MLYVVCFCMLYMTYVFVCCMSHTEHIDSLVKPIYGRTRWRFAWLALTLVCLVNLRHTLLLVPFSDFLLVLLYLISYWSFFISNFILVQYIAFFWSVILICLFASSSFTRTSSVFFFLSDPTRRLHNVIKYHIFEREDIGILEDVCFGFVMPPVPLPYPS